MTSGATTSPEDVQALRDELERITEELQETNRGVVALYAELDEQGARLREASEAKTRFLANISHELRSPLNSVLALAGLLREPDSDPITSEQDNQIRLIQSAAAQLLTLVNDLLDLAKAEAGALQPQFSTIDPNGLLHELLATLRPMAPAAVELRDAIEPLPAIRTDPVLLSQVLRNLMTNAVKYTEQGTITVAAHAQPGIVTIDVADTGIGIATEHQRVVFEPFFQVPHSLQSRVKGTGLGLPYAHSVVTALGGTLSVVSTLGVGSTFTVRLPTAEPGDPAATGAEIHLGTVLVVDDDEAVRLVLRRLLEGVADRVVEAGAAPEALAMMQTVHPDVVLLDLHMPGGGGVDVLRHLAQPGSPAARVVVITSADAADSGPIALGRPVVDKRDLTRPVLLDAIAASEPERHP